jgi:hypothetical protein
LRYRHLSPHAAELANAASQGGHGLAYGVQETLTSQTNHLAHHGTVGASELYAHLSGDNGAAVAGAGAGATGTMKVESLVGRMVGGYTLYRRIRKRGIVFYFPFLTFDSFLPCTFEGKDRKDKKVNLSLKKND